MIGSAAAIRPDAMKRRHATDGTSNRSRRHGLNDVSRADNDRLVGPRRGMTAARPGQASHLDFPCTVYPLTDVRGLSLSFVFRRRSIQVLIGCMSDVRSG